MLLVEGIGEHPQDGIQVAEAVLPVGREAVAFAPLVSVVEQEQFAAQALLRHGGEDAFGLAPQAFKVAGRNPVERPLTRAALSTCGRAKSKFLSVSISQLAARPPMPLVPAVMARAASLGRSARTALPACHISELPITASSLPNCFW